MSFSRSSSKRPVVPDVHIPAPNAAPKNSKGAPLSAARMPPHFAPHGPPSAARSKRSLSRSGIDSVPSNETPCDVGSENVKARAARKTRMELNVENYAAKKRLANDRQRKMDALALAQANLLSHLRSLGSRNRAPLLPTTHPFADAFATNPPTAADKKDVATKVARKSSAATANDAAKTTTGVRRASSQVAKRSVRTHVRDAKANQRRGSHSLRPQPPKRTRVDSSATRVDSSAASRKNSKASRDDEHHAASFNSDRDRISISEDDRNHGSNIGMVTGEVTSATDGDDDVAMMYESGRERLGSNPGVSGGANAMVGADMLAQVASAAGGGNTMFRGKGAVVAKSKTRERKQKQQHVVRAIQVREDFLRRIAVLAKRFDDLVTQCRKAYDLRKPQQKRTITSLSEARTRLTQSFVRLRELTSAVVERMNEWQSTLPLPEPFSWNGQSYGKKVLADLDYLDDMKSFKMWVGFTLARNPFVLSPEQLGDVDAQSLGIVRHKLPPFTQNLRNGPYSQILGRNRFVPPAPSSPVELLGYCEALSYLLFEEELVTAQSGLPTGFQHGHGGATPRAPSTARTHHSQKSNASRGSTRQDLLRQLEPPQQPPPGQKNAATKPKPFARDLGLKRTRHRLRREFLKGVCLMGDKHLVTIEMDRERHQFVITAERLKVSGGGPDLSGHLSAEKLQTHAPDENGAPKRVILKLERIEVAAFLTQISATELKACGIAGVRAQGLTPVVGSLQYGATLLTRIKTTPLCEYMCGKLDLAGADNDELALKFLS